MLASILSALHLLSLGIGLGAVFARGRALRALTSGDSSAVGRILFADNLWGLAAMLWIATGLTRLFGGFDKAPGFYYSNGFFWLKMGLFSLVFALEILPMVTFIAWRGALRRGAAIDARRVPLLVRLNDAETALVLVIPFAAAAMARGVWLLA
ncbi:MAG TPA: DUF2214 family protein [Candidatus Polarisedimenticolia bacterium]|nr:DUF2214 family protein [Candidatus Polarisedimenticolia bacterium]